MNSAADFTTPEATRLQHYLESIGIEFVPEDGSVRMRRDPQQRV